MARNNAPAKKPRPRYGPLPDWLWDVRHLLLLKDQQFKSTEGVVRLLPSSASAAHIRKAETGGSVGADLWKELRDLYVDRASQFEDRHPRSADSRA